MRNTIVTAIMTITTTTLLAACQGQNPFKRESNPLRKYPNTTENSTRPYVPGQKTAQPATAPGARPGEEVVPKAAPPCFNPVKVEVRPDQGHLSLKFVEGAERSYDLEVTIGGEQEKELKIDRPADADLRLTASHDKTYIYKLTWKPAKGSSAKKQNPVTVGFEGALPNGACPQSKNSLQLNVVVAEDNGAPSMTFQDLKKEIKFGDQFDFTVIVEDPNAIQGKSPMIQWEYGAKAGSTGLDAKLAVTKCQENQTLEGNKFEFLCHFDSNQINKVDPFLNTGKSAKASVQFTAISTKSEARSAPTRQEITIVFEQITPPSGAKKKTAPAPGEKK